MSAVSVRVWALRLLFACGAAWCEPLAAQESDPSRPLTTLGKRATALRVPNGTFRIDGRLDEETWGRVTPITDFVQAEPTEGAAPTDLMDVRIAYDDAALYVGARMASSQPIQAPLGRRDEGDQAEHILVSLDSYLDRRTSSTFGITAAGVRLDYYYASDDDGIADAGFNPVWDGGVAVASGGWTAELRIPFSQLRFNARTPQVWGLNLQRWVPSRNEEVYWALVPRTEERWASLFGDLHGLDGLTPSRRIELLPYVAGGSQIVGDRDSANPFTGGGNLEGRVGLDAKVGIGSNLTLEATVNPDFGQVEADPAEVNLSAFETFFSERRAFFLEGSQLLLGNPNNYFYSRRIGAAPAGRASGDYVDHPRTTTILGAAKLTGRLASGTSIGALAAVTDEESARTFSPGLAFGRVTVTPRTVFAVTRVQQELGSSGSTVALMATAMRRALPTDDPLAALLTRNALSISADSLLRLNDGEYDLRLFTGGMYVGGDATAINRVQRASSHYFHRPDAPYFSYDPTRTSLSGTKTGARIERRTGRHWLWEADSEFESPEFETNDIGRLTTADGFATGGEIRYRETVPGRWYREYDMVVRHERAWNYDWDVRRQAIISAASVTLPNFWEIDVDAGVNLRTQDDRLTRGGPLMQTPRSWSAILGVENNNAARTRGELAANYGGNEDGGLAFGVNGLVSLRPGAQWEVSARPSYSRQVETQQYVTTLAGGSAATYGGRYIFGRLDRSTYATEFRLNYTFKPDLTLDLYAQPFAASGRYENFAELAAARSRLLRRYGTGGTTVDRLEDGSFRVTDADSTFVLSNRDFNVLSFRSNVVLRWEWRLGSTLYLVWQQDRADDDLLRTRASVGDLFESVGTRGDHFFAVKASFWIAPR